MRSPFAIELAPAQVQELEQVRDLHRHPPTCALKPPAF